MPPAPEPTPAAQPVAAQPTQESAEAALPEGSAELAELLAAIITNLLSAL
jgi:hypothetical protein